MILLGSVVIVVLDLSTGPLSSLILILTKFPIIIPHTPTHTVHKIRLRSLSPLPSLILIPIELSISLGLISLIKFLFIFGFLVSYLIYMGFELIYLFLLEKGTKLEELLFLFLLALGFGGLEMGF